MRLRSLRERDLISSIRGEFASKAGGLVLGIGDDAAVIRASRRLSLLTTDLLIEDVHFIASLNPPYYLGRKSLNVNLSDIAAMGGKPRYALLGLALRKGIGEAWVRGFFKGLKAAAGEAGVALIGGDISAAKAVVVSISIVGEAGAFIPRSGAKPGDLIHVSGTLGDAAAGLRLLRKGFRLGQDAGADPLLRAFLDPKPRLALGRALLRLKAVSAMIDTSDGLSVDLLHLCEESGTGAEVERDKLPLSAALRRFEKQPERLALHGGEDYQLLFAVKPNKAGLVAGLVRRFRLRQIGRMTLRKGIRLVDGRGEKTPLPAGGYEHLK
jgi:thiamine-monophosphate kinase